MLEPLYPETAYQKCAISDVNWVDQETTTITADVVDGTLAARNVRVYQAGIPWGAADLASNSYAATLTMVFDRVRDVDVFAFTIPERKDDSADYDWTPLFGAGNLVRWRCYDAETGGTLLYETPGTDGFADVAMDDFVGLSRIVLDETVEGVRRVEMTVKFAGTPLPPNDTIRIGRVWIGPLLVFEQNFEWGDAWEPVTDEFGTPVRQFTLDLARVRDSERETVENLLQMVRTGTKDTRQVLWIPHMLDNRAAALVRIKSARLRSRYKNAHQLPITLVEDLAGL